MTEVGREAAVGAAVEHLEERTGRVANRQLVEELVEVIEAQVLAEMKERKGELARAILKKLEEGTDGSPAWRLSVIAICINEFLGSFDPEEAK